MEVTMISCDICGKEFKNTQGLRGHKNFVHNDKNSNTEEPVAQQATQQLLSSKSSTPVTTESQLCKLEARLEKLEYTTGLAEMNALEDILSNDKPLTEKITEVTEQLNHLTLQFSNCSKWFKPLSTVAGTMSRLEDELRSKAQNTRVNAMENRLRFLEEESKKAEKIVEKCFNMNTVFLDNQQKKVVEAIRNVVDTLVTAIKQLQDQVREQKQVTDWVKKEYNLRTVKR
jgi:uncharacterized coiled-coil protein SlyX